MRRRTFDLLATVGGLVLAIVLAVAGVLLLWGYHYANSNVHSQLAAQQITFPSKAVLANPPKGSTEITRPGDGRSALLSLQLDVA